MAVSLEQIHADGWSVIISAIRRGKRLNPLEIVAAIRHAVEQGEPAPPREVWDYIERIFAAKRGRPKKRGVQSSSDVLRKLYEAIDLVREVEHLRDELKTGRECYTLTAACAAYRRASYSHAEQETVQKKYR